MFRKDGWEMTKKRINAWWEGEIIDRCCVGVIVERLNIPSVIPESKEDKLKY